jgi:hypothetical protein
MVRPGIALAMLAAALAGCGGGDDDEPETRLTLRGDETEVTLGEATTLNGTVRPRVERVELVAAPGPDYADDRPVGSTTPDGRGGFRFEVTPRMNTAYSARASDGESEHVVVYASPRYRFRVSGARWRFEVEHPAELRPARASVQFYAGRENLYRRVGTARLEPRGRTRAVAAATLRAPGDAVDVLACLPDAIAPGYGAPPIKGCGERKLRLAQ